MPPASSSAAPDPDRQLQRRLGHRFQQPQLLRLALTHRSWRHEHATADAAADRAGESEAGDNERMEFLGDAVLGLRTCERLYAAFPQSPEGQLSRLRAWMVSARNLGLAAQRLGLGEHLRLSRAEEAIGGRDKQRLLANALEAVIAAIHLDSGYAASARFIDRHIIGASLEHLTPDHLHEFAYKSALQEWAHAAGRAAPVYRVVGESGPEHDKRFTVEVEIEDVYRGAASGASKKDAEQKAAAAALGFLGMLAGEQTS